MTDKMRSYVKGLMLGLCGKPLPMSQEEPVAYLYNGVRLPPPPEEVDQEANPFMCITIWQDSDVGIRYNLAFYATQVDYDADYAYATKFWVQPAQVYYLYANGEQVWQSVSATYTSATSENELVWANHDILYKDSTEVCLAASAPIPVYE